MRECIAADVYRVLGLARHAFSVWGETIQAVLTRETDTKP